jgi:maltose-binding protein MalE
MKHRFAMNALIAAIVVILTVIPAVGRANATVRSNAHTNNFTLTFWMCCTIDTTAAPYPQALALFKKQYPNASVNFVQKGRPEQELSAMQAAMMAHSEPDLYLQQIGNGDEGQFIKDGRQLNLDKYVKKYGWDKIYPKSLLKAQRRIWHGVYGVPHTNYWMGLWYKKDVLQKSHLPVPATYAQLLKDCAVLK